MLWAAGIDVDAITPSFVSNREEVRQTDYQPHPFLPYIFAPNRQNGGQRAYHNSLGFRSSTEFSFKKQSGIVRILTFGGSTTWGAQKDGYTWPEQLQKLLNTTASTPRFEVYNFGLNGALTPFSVVNLALHGIHYSPDIVIVYHGVNDLRAFGHSSLRTDYAHYLQDFQPNASYMGFRYLAPDWLFRSHLVTYFLYQLDRFFGFEDRGSVWAQVLRRYEQNHKVGYPKDRDKLYGIEVMQRNIKTMRALALEYGARFLGATFHFRDIERAPLNESLRAFFESEKIDYVDVESSLPHKDVLIQYDHVHFTNKGAEMMAAIMAAKIRSIFPAIDP